MGEFRMPSLGADMEAGKIVEWLVHEGDTVRRGDIVAVVDTDKADIDVEVFESGVVERIVVPAGERVPVGALLAEIRGEGTAAPVAPIAPVAAPVPEPAVAEASPAVSPVVRRLARHLGVDLATVQGTGPGGAVQRSDVESAAHAPAAPAPVAAAPPAPPAPTPAAAAAAAPEAPTAARPERATAMREAIGKLMARSWREIPHYRLEQVVDMSAASARLDDLNAARPAAERLLPAVLFGAAVARAAREHPDMNGFFFDGAHQPADAVHLGFAIALRGGGLVAPAIHHADTLTLDELATAMRDLVARARGGRLRASEMNDATITVTSLGDRGVDIVHGIIFPPQVALVGFGAVTERPWARDGMLGVHPVVAATLAADHRVSDGHAGALFLRRVAALLTTPTLLEEES